MTYRSLVIVAIVLALLTVSLWLLLPLPAQAPQEPGALELIATSRRPSPVATQAVKTFQEIRAADIAGISPALTFIASIPAGWRVEVVAGSEAVSFYDPTAAGATSLEKAQIFMRTFEASDFLTLSTVTIHSQRDAKINNLPAVRYDIEKRPDVLAFPSQPSWRNQRHIVTDIRVSESNPSVFYVIAKRPNLDEATYQTFLQKLQVSAEQQPTTLAPPVEEFVARITKKPFGIYITPKTSPVQPDRFTGWHTAVDVEYDDVVRDVPVRAALPGTVLLSRESSGYGGVVALQHEIAGEPVVGIYGHLKPASLPALGKAVQAGEEIGLLGDGETTETDGARKHLHFGLRKGTTVDIRGYVGSRQELTGWHNPLDFYS